MSKSKRNIAIIICGFISCIIGGFMLVNMWRWFIAIPFNLPLINFWQATGIDLMITYIVTTSIPKSIKTDDEALTVCIYTIIAPLITWLFGWICCLFM